MKNVGIYVRVSTGIQAEEGYSISEQQKRLISYCSARGWTVHKIYTDSGWSGSNLNRPAMENLINDVSEGRIDTVLVYKLDRLSRSQKDTLYLIEDVFLKNNVDFVSMQESFDTSTPFGRAVLSILSVFSQLERELIAERTFMGRIGRAKEGLWHGGGTHPIGYDYIDGELQINETEAEQVRMVFDLYAAGFTPSAIRDKMAGYQTKHGDWHHIETITTVLDNEIYAGTVHFDDVRSPDSHTAIISPSLYENVKHMRERSKLAGYGAKKSTHLLTGLLYCKHCGARYFSKRAPNGNHFYTCHSRAKVNKKMVKDPDCKNRNWPEADLDKIIEKMVLELAERPAMVNEIIEREKAAGGDGSLERENPDAVEIGRLDSEINRHMELYKNDKLSVDFISGEINALYSQKMLLLSKGIEAKEKRVVREFHIEGVKLLLKEISDAWISGGLEYRQKVLSDLIDRVELDHEEVKVFWSFV